MTDERKTGPFFIFLFIVFFSFVTEFPAHKKLFYNTIITFAATKVAQKKSG